MSFKFGLKNFKQKASVGAQKPASGRRKPLLGDDDEDTKDPSKPANVEIIGEVNFDELPTRNAHDSRSEPSSKRKDKPQGPPTRKAQAKKDDPSLSYSASTKEAERRAEEAMKLDSAIYDYDAAYDALHAKDIAKKAAEREDALQRRPKYMENLFESADVRKKDQLRARDKLLQREREAEGDEFADKEKFVTGAYKAQQEETRKAEVEEAKRQAIEDEKRRKQGMSGFHRKMLLDQEKRHQEAQAAMESAAGMAKNGQKPAIEEPEEKSARDIAREMQEKGQNVIINEEGQVADKRQLLTAGLNVVSKPKTTGAASASNSRPSGSQTGYQGRNSNQRATRERQTAMLADQIEKAAKRKAEEEAEEQQKLQRASKSQKTETDISIAKERYLQRKREAAAATAANGK